MAKDKLWFKHDHGARNDTKLKRLRIKLGAAGKGVYWDIIEMLYESGGSLPVNDCDVYANECGVEESLVASLINDFGLFVIKDGAFSSERVVAGLHEAHARSEAAKAKINKRWENKKATVEVLGGYENKEDLFKKNDTTVLPQYNQGNTVEVLGGYENKEVRSKNKEVNTEQPNTETFSGKPVKGKTNKPKKEIVFVQMPWGSDFKLLWEQWKNYKAVEFKFSYKGAHSEQASLNELTKLAGGVEANAAAIIRQSMANSWKGLFQLKDFGKQVTPPASPHVFIKPQESSY